MTDTADLRRLAEQATPGPWTAESTDHPEEFWYGAGHRSVATATEDLAILTDKQEADAAYIAAANPAAILALLDERRELSTLLSQREDVLIAAERRVAALEAAIIALKPHYCSDADCSSYKARALLREETSDE